MSWKLPSMASRRGVCVPIFLMDLSRCETCVSMTRCFNPGGLDGLEALDPGLASRAQAVGETGLELTTSAMWALRRAAALEPIEPSSIAN